MKGKFSGSLDIDPVGKNRVSDDTIYTPGEKKKLKPNKACLAMYGKNNDDANEIVELLIGDYGRQLEHVPVSGHSFYDAFLVQISRDRNKYKNEQTNATNCLLHGKVAKQVLHIGETISS